MRDRKNTAPHFNSKRLLTLRKKIFENWFLKVIKVFYLTNGFAASSLAGIGNKAT